MPVEGERPREATAGDLTREDVVTCGLDDEVGVVRERIARSPYPFAVVIAPGRVVLGRLPASTLNCEPSLRAEEIMEPGPSTVRPHKSASGVAAKLAERELRWAIVTTPEGRLIGVAARAELEAAASEPPRPAG
jgi:CBS domain-containing protein